MTTLLRVLIVEDDPNEAELGVAMLEESDFTCQWDRVETKEAFLQHLSHTEYDLVLSDYNMPHFDGITALKLFLKQGHNIPFIFISGVMGEEAAIESLKMGATDYVLKNRLSRLVPVVRRALEENEEKWTRVNIELALKESEKRYRTLFETARDAIFIFEAEGDNKGVILDANPAAAEMHGYTREELLSSNITTLMSGESIEDSRSRLTRTLAGEWVKDEVIHRKKNGAEFPVEISGGVFDLGDKKMILGINRDISEKKQKEAEARRLEAQLHQAQKMEAIGTLAGGIAHDFNNILSAIIGYTELALLEVKRDAPISDNLKNILQAGNRAKELVSHILAFSKHKHSEKRPVIVKNMVEEVLKLISVVLPSNIDIRKSFTSESKIMADPSHLHQILMNLYSNASYSMGERGGVLEIILDDMDITHDHVVGLPPINPGYYVRLKVKDTGCGMSKEVAEKVFDPYFSTKKEHGSGMGLSVVHGIIKGYGGYITVDSQPGEGTLFTIYLPILDNPDEDIQTQKPVLQKGTERILFIDDEPFQTNVGSQMLERLGYSVVSETSSERAYEIVASKPEGFDLVITDMTMPKMTGEILAKKIFAVRPEMPIILCTGYSEFMTETKAKTIGIKGFIMKPYNLNDIAAKVREVLDGA